MDAPRQFTSPKDAWEYLRRKAAAKRKQERREKIESDKKLIIMNTKIQEITGRWFHKDEIRTPVPVDRLDEYFARLESNGMWEEVFKNLTSLSDITSAFFSCDMFSDHLEKKRILMLLPLVFEVLKEKKYLHYIKPEGKMFWWTNEDLLPLRLVSKAWKVAADKQFLSPIGFSQPDWHLSQSPDLRGDLMIMSSPFKCTFRKAEDVEKALEILGTSQLCASLVRVIDIIVKDPSDQEKERLYSSLGNLLDRHGEHVWAFGFALCKGRFDYDRLTNFVLQMPHLKELFVKCKTPQEEEDLLDMFSEDEERRLVARFPFPIIPSLKRLTLFNLGYGFLSAEIMQRNPSLKTVSIQEDDPRFLEKIFPALENHRLECFDFTVTGRWNISLAHVQPLGQLQWPLKVLHLSYGSQDEPEYESRAIVNAYDFIGILNRFNETLSEVELGAMILSLDHEDGRNVVVEFPNLKTIEKETWARQHENE